MKNLTAAVALAILFLGTACTHVVENDKTWETYILKPGQTEMKKAEKAN